MGGIVQQKHNNLISLKGYRLDDVGSNVKFKILESKVVRQLKPKLKNDKFLGTIVDLFDENGNHTNRLVFLLIRVPKETTNIKYDPHIERFQLLYRSPIHPKLEQRINSLLNYAFELDFAIRLTYTRLYTK